MIVDVVFAVAVISCAAGAVTEFQLGITDICAAAYGTAVGIGCFDCGSGGLVRTGTGEGNDFCAILLRRIFFLLKQAAGVETPGYRKDIDKILAEKQEIVQQGNEGEKTVGEKTVVGHGDHLPQRENQIKHTENPGLYGDDKEQQKTGIGKQSRVGKEKTQIQTSNRGPTSENQTENILQ